MGWPKARQGVAEETSAQDDGGSASGEPVRNAEIPQHMGWDGEDRDGEDPDGEDLGGEDRDGNDRDGEDLGGEEAAAGLASSSQEDNRGVSSGASAMAGEGEEVDELRRLQRAVTRAYDAATADGGEGGPAASAKLRRALQRYNIAVERGREAEQGGIGGAQPDAMGDGPSPSSIGKASGNLKASGNPDARPRRRYRILKRGIQPPRRPTPADFRDADGANAPVAVPTTPRTNDESAVPVASTPNRQAWSEATVVDMGCLGIESLVGYRMYKGNEQWQVRWHGYGAEDDTWETLHALTGGEWARLADQLRREHVRACETEG